MNLRKHGTFQIMLWRPTFVVIGSDTSAMLNMESVAGHPSKLVCHDTLPLAIGIGGMAEFTINDKETIVEQLLRDEFPAWGRLERFGIRIVIDWAKTVLQPRVQEGIDDEPHIPQQVTLLVGTMNRGAAELGVDRHRSRGQGSGQLDQQHGHAAASKFVGMARRTASGESRQLPRPEAHQTGQRRSARQADRRGRDQGGGETGDRPRSAARRPCGGCDRR